MTKVKEGDLEKLGLLFERYHRMLFAFFYRLNSSQEVAEDLVQEVFERIMKYRKTFKGDGAFKTWMFHIARNLNHDHYKKIKKELGKEKLDDWEDQMTDFEDKKEQSKKERELKLLELSMDKLPADKKELLVMSKLKGMKYKDIGEVYSVSEGNIKVRVFRALKDLQDEFQILMKTDV